MDYSKHLSVCWRFFIFCLLVFVPVSRGEDDIRLTPVVRAVASAFSSVVSIGTQETVQVNDGYDRYYHDFYGQLLLPRRKLVKNYVPLGSGVIVDARGLLVTNRHVVRRAKTYEIRLWNGKSCKARIVGYDEPNDLALLQIDLKGIEGEKLQPIRFARPNDLYLGETVITIGNPFGLDHSVSQGVLSAMNRSYEDDVSFDDYLQTDAAINPGNSGGPLVNLRGEMIGINQAIRRDASGIGFAIPVKRIEEFICQWLMPSRFSAEYLGLDELRRGKRGVILGTVKPGSPAARAGLQGGDEVVEFNGRRLERLLDFGTQAWQLNAGKAADFVLADGRRATVKPEPMPDDVLIETRLGFRVQTLTPDLCEAIDLPRNLRGVVINRLQGETAYRQQLDEWRQMFKRGDIILKVQDQPISSEEDLARHLRAKRTGDSIALLAIIYEINQSRTVIHNFRSVILK